MGDQRKTDTEPYRKFRLDRITKEDGQWYFATREKTLEGPYISRAEAEYKLESYKKLINSVFLPRENTLSLDPLAPLAVKESRPLH